MLLEGENRSGGVVPYPFLFHGAENHAPNQITERVVNAFYCIQRFGL